MSVYFPTVPPAAGSVGLGQLANVPAKTVLANPNASTGAVSTIPLGAFGQSVIAAETAGTLFDGASKRLETNGGVANCISARRGAIASASTAFTASDAAFVIGDVGKTIVILGAGVAGSDLTTTIAAYTSATAVTLTLAAGATVTAARYWYGTDNRAALAALCTSVGTGNITIGNGGFLVSGAAYEVPATINLIFEKRGRLCVPTPGLTIAGTVQAGHDQIFDIGSSVLANRILTSAVYASPAWFGAVGDFRSTVDASITDGSPTLISATAAFTSADVGKRCAAYVINYAAPDYGIVVTVPFSAGAITAATTTLTSSGGFTAAHVGRTVKVAGAGVAGAALITTIATYISATQVTLTAAASTTVSGVTSAAIEFGVYGNIIAVNSATSATLDANATRTATGTMLNIATPANLGFQRALACVNAAGGGTCEVPTGDFAFTQPPAADGNSILLQVFDNTKFTGVSRVKTILRQFANNSTFSRLIGGKGSQNSRVESMTLDGNKIPQVNSAEHQHAMFFQENGATPTRNLILTDLLIKNVRGDGIYLYAGPVDTTISLCTIEETNRTSVHAQTFDGLVITQCIFRNSTGQGHIKGEPDGAGQFGRRASITANLFDQGSGFTTFVFGILIAGSAGYETRDMSIVGNSFRNHDLSVTLGVYNVGVTITGNTFENCIQALNSSNFALGYGFDGNSNIVFSGNVIREARHSLGIFPVHIANGTGIVVTGNVIDGPALKAGIELLYCKNAVIADNAIVCRDSSGYIGIYLSRTQRARVHDNVIQMSGVGVAHGIYMDDAYALGSYDNPMQDIDIGVNSLLGTFYAGVTFNAPGSPNSARLSVTPQLAGQATFGAGGQILDNRGAGAAGSAAFGYTTFGHDSVALSGRKITHGTASPASDAITRTWAVGDLRISTAFETVSGGRIRYGWICTVAGVPGTWISLYLET